MNGKSRLRFRQQAEIESAPLEGECVLYNPEADRFLHLNRTASFIWGRIKDPASAEEIAGDLVRRFSGVTTPDAIRDVSATLEELVSMSVVESLPAPEAAADRENR